MSESRTIVWATIAMAIATSFGVGVAIWAVSDQHQNARELLNAQISAELDKEFDSTEVRRARRTFATGLLKHEHELSDWRVLDFFDKVGMYRRLGRVDTDSVYSAFSYYVERYWLASQDLIKKFRKQEKDYDFYADFEQLNTDLSAMDARDKHRQISDVTPTPSEVERFLQDEANLSIPPRCP